MLSFKLFIVTKNLKPKVKFHEDSEYANIFFTSFHLWFQIIVTINNLKLNILA